MNRLKICSSTSYDVIVQNNILNISGDISRDTLGGNKAFIVTDRNVGALYLSVVVESFRNAGYDIYSAIIQPGEASKSFENYEFILSQLVDSALDKSDIVVALGGGMIGDLVGFAASTFKRGINLVQIPTSLLACVDSCVGGKTAINLANAKNQIGSFYNPSLVICDSSVILTQSNDDILDGYAEIIKYGILSDSQIIEELRIADNSSNYTDVILKALNCKKKYVEADEHDTGLRQYLNFGHLVGHAIEAYNDYTISHGHAVALGIAIEARACALSGLTTFATYNTIIDILTEFGFILDYNFSISELLPYLRNDKRLSGGSIKLIVPRTLGDCYMSPMSLLSLEAFLALAL